MKKLVLALLLVSGVVVVGHAQPPAEEPKQPARALPPNKLDEVFADATTEKQLTEALINNEVYKKAIKAALKAKKDAEADQKQNPTKAGPSPAQAARTTFLKVLSGKHDE